MAAKLHSFAADLLIGWGANMVGGKPKTALGTQNRVDQALGHICQSLSLEGEANIGENVGKTGTGTVRVFRQILLLQLLQAS